MNEKESSKQTVPFLLADIGEGIAEVELLQWFVSPGDSVRQFDPVCEVQSDKATVEITSRYDGVVTSLEGQVGDIIAVGNPLMHLTLNAGNNVSTTTDAPPKLSSIQEEEHVQQSLPDEPTQKQDYGEHDLKISASGAIPAPNNVFAKILATPAVRRLGKENNIDLMSIEGSGRDGRVVKSDVLRILAKQDSGVVSSNTQKDQPMSDSALATTTKATTTMPIRGYSRLMIKSMEASLQLPHMCYSDEVDMTQLKECRSQLQQSNLLLDSSVNKLSYLPFFVKAASLAIKDFPMINATIDAEACTMTYHVDHHIGVAMDTSRGLAVPVVRSCQNKSVLEIAIELNRLRDLASTNALNEHDIANPTFTMSNIGAIGGTYMSPIVTPPQVAIGAMGKIQRLPRFVDDHSDEIRSAHIMQISWAADHRAIDGATMARFSNRWKSLIESPMTMTIILS